MLDDFVIEETDRVVNVEERPVARRNGVAQHRQAHRRSVGAAV